MRTKHLFYLLLALPFILSSCDKNKDKDDTPKPDNYDVRIEAKYLLVVYWGDAYSPGVDNFSVIIAEDAFQIDLGGTSLPEGSYYCLDIYAPKTEDGKLPVGTYTFDTTESYAEWSIDSTMSCLIEIDANGNFLPDEEGILLSDATLVISENYAELTAVIDDKTHYVTFSGKFEHLDSTIEGGDVIRLTTLTNDVEVESDAAMFVAEYDQELAYIFVMENYSEYGAEDGALFMLEITLTEGNDNISGTYSIADGTLAVGTYDSYGMWGSWYFDTMDGELGTKYAAIDSGSVTFNQEGGGCTMALDCTDCEGHTIKATLSGAFISDSVAPEALTRVFNR